MQRDIGLYTVQTKYFKSLIFWVLGYIPGPGVLSLLFLFFLGLSVRLYRSLSLKKIGTFVIHSGVLILLFGGFLTAFFSKEGFMVMSTGINSSIYVDQSKYDIVVLKDNKLISRLSLLKPFTYKISNELDINFSGLYRNASLFYKNVPLSANEASGIARFFDVDDAPMFLDDNYNNVAIEFSVSSGEGKRMSFILLDSDSNFITLPVNGVIYQFVLVKSLNVLPFSVYLESFKKDLYFTSSTPKSYKSVIFINDSNFSWKYHIEMNKPLRYKGFAFYQSSFVESQNGVASVLLVTADYGEYFPYIAFFVLLLGFFLHVFKILRL